MSALLVTGSQVGVTIAFLALFATQELLRVHQSPRALRLCRLLEPLVVTMAVVFAAIIVWRFNDLAG